MISHGKHNLSCLMNEIFKEPYNNEEWSTLLYFFSKEDKSKVIPVASLLSVINLNQ